MEFHRFPTHRIWNRDSGPIFALDGQRKLIARFKFNAWAKYPDWRRDVRIPERAARALKVPLEPVLHGGREVILEGGAIDVNGRGSILTTEECLLDLAVQVRNPGFGREDFEQVFREVLSARNTIWLGRGIAGDDSHGHVDDGRCSVPRARRIDRVSPLLARMYRLEP